MVGQWTDPGQGMRPSANGSVTVIDDERIESYLDLEHRRYFESCETTTKEGDRCLYINVATSAATSARPRVARRPECHSP